ncbi:MAG: tryptophan-rich sensory protein [Candidatus Levybacteria bacterium]|nr:tryptophan-rich sensory protein [Candidatus Levybacteria bacterium]
MNTTYDWYQLLDKPSWAPPSWLFGPVWTMLYILIAISFGYLFYKVFTKKLPFFIAVPFVVNLIANFAFTPLQFGLRNNILAATDILIVLVSFLWIYSYRSVFKKKKMMWVLYINIPYFLWVSFATILQLTVTYLNWN